MRSGPFARFRQARSDERELGTELWRRVHDRFVRSLDRYWQVVESTAGTASPEEINGLTNAGNVLAEHLPRVRRMCVQAHELHPDEGLDIPAEFSDLHRILSRAANDLAMTAQAAALFKQGQTDLLTVGRRATKVIDAIEEAEALDVEIPAHKH